MAEDDDERKKTIRGYIDNTEIKLLTAISNGLFNQKDIGGEPTWRKIQDLIGEAREHLEKKEFAKSETKQAMALGHIHDALSKTEPYWRFVNVYAGPIWLYLVGILVSLFAFFFINLDAEIQSKMGVSEDVIFVCSVGYNWWDITCIMENQKISGRTKTQKIIQNLLSKLSFSRRNFWCHNLSNHNWWSSQY